MAEENTDASLTPEIISQDGGNSSRKSLGKSSAPNVGHDKSNDHRRASTGSYHYGVNSRRNSTGKAAFPNKEEKNMPDHIRASAGSFHIMANSENSTGKPNSPNSGSSVLPHYLRASTGSCHDFCKYGIKHEVVAKARHPIPKRLVPPSDRQQLTESRVPVQRKATSMLKAKPSPVSRVLTPDSPSVLKQEVSSPSNKVEVSSRLASSSKKKMAHVENKKNISGERTPVKPKTMTVKPSCSPGTKGGLNGRNSEIKRGKKTGTSKASVEKALADPPASLSPKPSISRVMSLNVKKHKNVKVLSPLKDQNGIRKAEQKLPNNEKVVEKTLHVVKVETENKVLESVQNGNTLHSPPSLTQSSPKFSSPPKSPALSFHEEGPVVDYEHADSEVNETYESISESSEGVSLHEVDTSVGNCNRIPGEARFGLSSDNDSTPVKLKFKRGKVVDLQSENSGPRRLRFRRGRVLGENQGSKAGNRRRNFKKRVDDDTNQITANSEKVALRHQDVQGKKDAQGLFNNVIEETASKLVESRKSKVKALVGAFETVISLQDTKPSVQTVT
ncbi:uncharacterized protein LOC127804132 [Diospyros lotus]|uniref:uncharacterized protein LOC127804132 n=1 Tax=Diospyros lotus TaxID=55363 RepID=UPI002258132F|nr:uncharacterized protein LOC127804132 [Diospyros lotus]XP_052196845.1 uncharacterized protein LOC127804132 [Diospyros lotus]XP_052196846.1 uncharacterized protein LOC127804132 [Diospyros lotus]XP_052196847.1 uncharacterized protein LOC127804132 [Diospyros lotus]XP_052196848.1 uncharacterized protein LOC127804132 [Diospyros lotus]XP_052196849.1 uncharacterized protein LOC127804132 [Diospyros lotus]